jgi:hypothetical protein
MTDRTGIGLRPIGGQPNVTGLIQTSARIGLAIMCMALAACAPQGVPSDASRNWDLKTSFFWTWSRPVGAGCTAWMAKDKWASVLVLLDSHCDEDFAALLGKATGVQYSTTFDEMIFVGYWPRVREPGGRPCPQSISNEGIAELRTLSARAVTGAKTEGERRVLRRIDERLARVNGANLQTHRSGWCDDSPQRTRVETWPNG